MIEEKIISHLKEQYSGIFSEDQIIQHIEDYVGNRQAQYLIKKISPLVSCDANILDIGSGYGSFVLLSNKMGYKTSGIELEQFEYEISQEKAQLEGLPSSIFNLGSALDLPFEDDSFDVVTFWNVLEHVPDYKKSLSEANRILKKGGKIFIIAPNYSSFRKEAHYHVPWIPFFPKWLAKHYLTFLGKNSWFFENCIFYVSMARISRELRKMNFTVTTDISEKIRVNHCFKANWFNNLLGIFKKLHLLPFLIKTINFLKTHPFAHSIDLTAIKND
jgi:MPBQ/MSBQ methyltransferase